MKSEDSVVYCRLILAGVVFLLVGSTSSIPFAKAGEAHRILADRENVGKVVLMP